MMHRSMNPRAPVSHGRVVSSQALGNVHSLKIAGCDRVRDVSKLGGVRQLNCRSCKMIDVGALGAVSVAHAKALPAHAPRRQRQTASTSICELERCAHWCASHAMLTPATSPHTRAPQVDTLDLGDNRELSDVSGLGRVRVLGLANLPKLVNVSALGAVHTVNLTG